MSLSYKPTLMALLLANLVFTAQAVELNIPSQSLDKALNALAHQSGERILFSTALTEHKQSPALRGDYTVRQALEKLLENSGLALKQTDSKSFTVIRLDVDEKTPQLLNEVHVQAAREGNGLLSRYEANQASYGALGEKTLLDTPFSVRVVKSEEMVDRQVTNIADVFRLDAAVTASSNGVARESSMITVRGLALDLLNGYKIDGLNISAWNTDLPIEHFEQIELLKGLSGFMYGFAQPGGILNYKLKRAGDTPMTRVTAGLMTDSQYNLNLDIGRRFADDRLGLRVNYVHEGGDTYLDTPIKRDSASAALDIKLSDQLTIEADTLYQKRKVNGSMFALVVDDNAAAPKPIDGAKRLTQDFTYHETEMLTAGTGLRWAFNDDWNISTAVRMSKLKRTNYDSYLYINDDAGNYDDGLVQWYSEHTNLSANMMVNGRFDTGSIKHALVAGTDMQTVHRSGAPDGFASLGAGNLYGGRSDASNPHSDISKDVSTIFRTRNVGVFVSDTIEWTPQWSTIIGLRHSSYRKTQPGGETFDKSKVTPTYALLWKPQEALTAYVSYVEALEEGNTAPLGTNNKDQSFGPLESKQYELGLKQQGSFWSAEAALFRMQRGLAYTNSSDYYVQQTKGLVLSGLDLAGRVELGSQWALRGSMVLMHSENNSDDVDVNGKDAPNAPKFTATLFTDYQMLAVPGVTLSAGMRYVGDRYLEARNIHRMDSYTLFDLGARYQTKLNDHRVTMRAAIQNLTNEKYWQTHGDWNFLTQGEPRIFKVSAQVDF
ncbi:TonB-dependent receptor [Methylophilus sp. QUAN]|uniref:TonB-dependent siderophore receptor n=1 Tax=Methylophilus sp. QUAN TaxID=2781020 RepID=UPI001890A802|nr:TonB-dependent receptor [Methylophilus sp. QUAN]MBF4991359.1 TonB-dependent receptor [Methylophilus sp. QUAN]